VLGAVRRTFVVTAGGSEENLCSDTVLGAVGRTFVVTLLSVYHYFMVGGVCNTRVTQEKCLQNFGRNSVRKIPIEKT
jgi:hypothetical protein